MIGNESVVDYLNEVLKAQLTAANQYWLDAGILAGWNYRGFGERSRCQSVAIGRQAEAVSRHIRTETVQTRPTWAQRKQIRRMTGNSL